MSDLPFSPPANPILVRVRRGAFVESVHRAAFTVRDADGRAVDGLGDTRSRMFARSAIKALQALPLIETGAADRFGLSSADLALSISSHNAEAQHTERAAAMLERLGLDASALRCGSQSPGDPAARQALKEADAKPTALHNNCSGKHAGFLTLGAHLGADPARYLDASDAVQSLVRTAVGEMCDADPASLTFAIDGCSAPTWRLSLDAMATAFARLVEPDALEPGRAAAARRLIEAGVRHPELVAGEHKRLDTALMRVSDGNLFCKVGAEAVYLIANRERGHGLAIKVDDGGYRGLFPLVVGLCVHLGWLERDRAERLTGFAPGPHTNWAGLEVGTIEVGPFEAPPA